MTYTLRVCILLRMNTGATSTYARVNITLPKETVRLIDRVTRKTNRSGFVNEAVRFYVANAGRTNLAKLLRAGAKEHATRDLSIAEEWFPLEEEVWQKSPRD